MELSSNRTCPIGMIREFDRFDIKSNGVNGPCDTFLY